MRILVTNDDGVDSEGLHVLARAVADLGDVMVVAPNTEYSGASAALGSLRNIRPEVRRARIDGIKEAWALSGTPALCVMLARLGAFGDPYDVVVSGINPGANVGRAVYHSGTVGAVMTARLYGYSGVAVSQAVAGVGVEGQGWDEMLEHQQWHSAAAVARHALASLMADPPAVPVVVNVNVPNLALTEIAGWTLTSLGQSPGRVLASAALEPLTGHAGAFTVKMDWGDTEVDPPHTDTSIVAAGRVSVSVLGGFTDIAASTAVPHLVGALDDLWAGAEVGPPPGR